MEKHGGAAPQESDMNESSAEVGQSRERGCADGYLAKMALWQQENGGFRRVPIRADDRRLYNWIHRCRFNHKYGRLNDTVREQLIVMGVISEDPMGKLEKLDEEVYERAREGVRLVHELGLEDGMCTMETARDKESVRWVLEWLGHVKRLKRYGEAPMLMEDLKRMIPLTFARQVEDLGDPIARPEARKRREKGMLESSLEFVGRVGRLPDIMSGNEEERMLASWLIQVESGLIDEQKGETRCEAAEATMEKLRAAIRKAKAAHRNSQWRWWSQVALSVMRAEGFAKGWEEQVWKVAPEEHADRLEMSIVDARDGKQGWGGGPWGVDMSCIRIAIERVEKGVASAQAILGIGHHVGVEAEMRAEAMGGLAGAA